MRYEEHAPAPALRHLVECYWTMDGAGAPHRVLPDGCFDLLFELDGDTPVRLIGVMTRALVTASTPPTSLLGVRFRPGTELALAGVAASESRDRTLDLADVWGKVARELDDRVRLAGGTSARVALLDAEIAARRARAVRVPDPRVRAAVAAIHDARGAIAVPSLAARLGIGERQLERAFDEHVGLSPKALAKIVRMRAAIGALTSETRLPLVAIAHAAGYADQAHMTRDFRSLAGVTPGAYVRERREPQGAQGTQGTQGFGV